MALKHQEQKASNKVRVIVITILASIFLGALLAWVIFQTGFWNTLYINSLQLNTANPELNEPIKNTQKMKNPSTFSLEAIESWHSWMQTNGLYQKVSKKHLDNHKDQKSSPNMKNILLWNDRNDDSSLATEDYWDGTLLPLEVAGCPVSQCQLINRLRPSPSTSNDLKLAEFDAIVFRYNDLNVKDLPERRWPTQRYVFYEPDSPIISRFDAGLAEMIPPDFFNLTMTYRWDSDIVVPKGGWIEPVASKIIDDHQTAENSKSKMIAWMVNDAKECPTVYLLNRRPKDLIDYLKKYNIQVDIIRQSDCTQLESIDDCGSESSTSKNEDISLLQCRQKVAKEYAFYFAMEEDFCLDYITEKFYSMLDHPIIPLVMDAHGNYAKAAPPHSYINALDFPSVRSLANYLIGLSENNHLYNEYFLWKKYFKVRRHDKKGGDMNHLCNLCALLHEEKQPEDFAINQRNGSYKDISDWWIREARCTRLGEYGMIEEAVIFPFEI